MGCRGNCKSGPGSYPKLVTIQKPKTTGQDAAGHIDLSDDSNWEDVSKAYCKVLPQSGKEFYRAQKTEANITHVLETQYSTNTAAIDPSYRIRLGTRSLNVVSAINEEEMNKTILISCIEAV